MLNFVKVAYAQGLVPPCPPSGCGWNEFNQLVQNIFNFFIVIAVPLAVLVIVYGAILLMTSGGSENRIQQGKRAIFSAIVGLAIVFGSYIIITTVIKAISN